jgi:hypothetical protein
MDTNVINPAKKLEFNRIKKLTIQEGLLKELGSFMENLNNDEEKKEIVTQYILEKLDINSIDDFYQINDTTIDDFYQVTIDDFYQVIQTITKIPVMEIFEGLKNIQNILSVFQNKTNKRKLPKKQLPNAKFNQNKSAWFSSKLSSEILKEYKSEQLKSNIVKSSEKNMDIGNLKIEQIVKETDTSYILENYKTISFSREEIQVYLALLNVYMQNVKNKKDYGIPFEISTKDFHNNILGRKNRLRKEDLQKYESIFQMIRSKTIIYNPESATIKPFNKKEFKNIRINDNLMNLGIISSNDYKDQIIRIVPSALTMLELKNINQFSNCLPVEIIKLPFKKSDNILYFALYLTNLHRNNESHFERKKGRIFNKAFKKEIYINTIIKKALSNYEELFNRFEEYKTNNSNGKLFFDKQILIPLKETLEIFKNHGYIDKNYKIPIYSKNILEQKIEVIFNYDTAKLIETDRFKKDEKK